MTRSHRRWHLWLWTSIGPLAAAGLILGLWSRPTLELKPADSLIEVPAQVYPMEVVP